jgi:hypothetical protein
MKSIVKNLEQEGGGDERGGSGEGEQIGNK